jgi:phage baseplate assembly protein W
MATKQAIFSDLDLNFTRHPITDDVSRKTDAAAVNQSLRNLILTANYERPFNSNIGSPIRALMFEPYSPMLRVLLKTVVEQTVENFEPRISLQDVIISPNESNNSLEINIYYYILNSTSLQSFQMTLERTR